MVPGILCAGVPGAGGVDAMYAVTLSVGNTDSRSAVERLWSKWNESGPDRSYVCALTLEAEYTGKSGISLENSSDPCFQ